MSVRAIRAAWLVLAVGGPFRLRSRLLRPPRHRYSAVEGGQVVGLLGGDGLLPGVGLGAGGCGGWGVVVPDDPGQQGDGDERQAADEGQAVDDPAHEGDILSGGVRGCSVVLGCLGCATGSELRDPPGGANAIGAQDGVVVGRSGGGGLVAGLGQSRQRGDVAHGAGGQEGAGLIGGVGQLAVGGQLVQAAPGGAGQAARLRRSRWEQIGGEQLGDRQDGRSGLGASDVVGVVGRGHEGCPFVKGGGQRHQRSAATVSAVRSGLVCRVLVPFLAADAVLWPWCLQPGAG